MAGPSAATKATRSALSFTLWAVAVVLFVLTAFAIMQGWGSVQSNAYAVLTIGGLGLAAHFVGRRGK